MTSPNNFIYIPNIILPIDRDITSCTRGFSCSQGVGPWGGVRGSYVCGIWSGNELSTIEGFCFMPDLSTLTDKTDGPHWKGKFPHFLGEDAKMKPRDRK